MTFDLGLERFLLWTERTGNTILISALVSFLVASSCAIYFSNRSNVIEFDGSSFSRSGFAVLNDSKTGNTIYVPVYTLKETK